MRTTQSIRYMTIKIVSLGQGGNWTIQIWWSDLYSWGQIVSISIWSAIKELKVLFSVRIIVRLKMINYIEIFEEERIVWKKVKNVILNKNAKESCIQKATVIMLFIGPYDLVNTCWPNIKYVIEKYFSRSNSLVDQMTFPSIWTYPWKFLISFSFLY